MFSMIDEYKSLDDIKNKLSLTVDLTNIDEVRRELIIKLAEVHPDRNNGEFKNENDKILYNDISRAIEFIDNNANKTLQIIPVSAITDIIRLIKEIIPKNNINEEKAEEKDLYNRFDIKINYGNL